jgi:K+-sensing histidine kinase KdpD
MACLTTRERDIAAEIIEQAQACQCSTIAVGRASFSWLREYFEHHVADELVRQGQGLAIWVVE